MIFKLALLTLLVGISYQPPKVRIALCTFNHQNKPVEAYVRIYSLPDTILVKSDYTKGRCDLYLERGEYHFVLKHCNETSLYVKADRNKQALAFLNDDCRRR